ncbi:MAG: FliH/SctL family protein, partial [Phycisphaerae bacterium]
MAGLIKREHAPVAPAFSFDDLTRRGSAMIADAQRQAAQILAAARDEAGRLYETERKRGHAEGLTQGRREGSEKACKDAAQAAMKDARARVTELLGALQAGVNDFDQAKRALIAQAESGVIRLAMSIARRICKARAGQSSDVAVASARRLLEMVRSESDMELCVSIADFEAVRSSAADFIKTVNSSLHCRVLADENIAPGDCILRGRSGT